ncbi:deoxynucleotide monophosphate kinase family protein [Streptomyces sp. NPDC001709]
MTIPLIGLAGAARSGKDSAAQALLDAGWSRRAFADKVRDILYAMNPVLDEPSYSDGFTTLRYEVDQYGWDAAKETYPEVRRYLQRLGTEGGRGVLGENVWVDALFRDFTTWGATVITDVRFPNEAEAIRAHGGLVVAIERPGQEPIREAGHVSENALAGYLFDDVIRNDGTLAQLHDRVMQLIPITM